MTRTTCRGVFTTVAEVWAALEEQRGWTGGEAVDLWEHAFQTAAGLQWRGADDELVVAGLLHDLGDGRVAAADHARWAAALVRPLFGERVAWLIEQHAEAKRYRCAVEPSYWDQLSPVSQETLRRQGGVMTVAEAEQFATHPWARDAVLLRECDDAGKDPSVVSGEHAERFRMLLARSARGAGR